jgi:hypothetical protein
MLESDYFAKKKKQLGFDRVDHLAVIQVWCDTEYPGQVRAKQFHRGVLRLITASAVIAGELRWRQIELMGLSTFDEPVLRIQISIGSLENGSATS